jgi:hypothetical protein
MKATWVGQSGLDQTGNGLRTAVALFVAGVASLLAILMVFGGSKVAVAAEKVTISDYRPVFIPCYNGHGTLLIAIRQYNVASVPFCLLVNPNTLETSTAKAATLDFSKGLTPANVAATPFVRALNKYTAPPFKLQNHGILRGETVGPGVFLTVDMCPSKRSFEREMFAAVGQLKGNSGETVPLAIAMTGSWLQYHSAELAWLESEINAGRLAVTWVNHSHSHPYVPGVPLGKNFLLSAGVDFDRELLATEVLLLERGLVPGPFFRFPGLVADGRLVERLRELSLVPVGSDAWLAKGETPSDRSIILVHGNGNEPLGITRLLPLLAQGRQKLLPLRLAIDGVVK